MASLPSFAAFSFLILYAAKVFEKGEVITVYVGEDIGQAGSEEAAVNMRRLIAQNKGRHVMQINRRNKGRRDNVRLIDGERGFTGAQNANTAKGTKRKNNVEFGETGTFLAKGENRAQRRTPNKV